MARTGSSVVRGCLVALVLAGLLLSQGFAAFSSDHSDDDDRHCCLICHVGHSLIASPAPTLDFTPPAAVRCDRPEPLEHDFSGAVVISGRASRAPPRIS